MNLTKINEYEYEINCKPHQLDNYFIKLNSEVFSLREIVNDYYNDLMSLKTVEVLPGIYLTVNSKCFDFWGSKFIARSVFLRLIPAYNLTLTIKNRKDDCMIKKTKCDFKNLSKRPSYNIKSEGISLVNPKVLPYPDSMGSGGNRCIVWRIFEDLGLLDSPDSKYRFFKLSQILKNVTENQQLLSLCKKQDPCGNLLKKFTEGTYRCNKDSDRGNIRVSLQDGTYAVSDGNHRICVARRFGVDSIPVWQNEYIKITDELSTSEINDDRYSHNAKNAKNLMEEYHSILDKLGIGYDVGSALVETPLDQIDIVRFLEIKTGIRIVELAELARKKPKDDYAVTSIIHKKHTCTL